MRNFLDTFETHKRSFINAFSVCMIAPLRLNIDLLLTYLSLTPESGKDEQNISEEKDILLSLQIRADVKNYSDCLGI